MKIEVKGDRATWIVNVYVHVLAWKLWKDFLRPNTTYCNRKFNKIQYSKQLISIQSKERISGFSEIMSMGAKTI